jgi:hypothetical protein
MQVESGGVGPDEILIFGQVSPQVEPNQSA